MDIDIFTITITQHCSKTKLRCQKKQLIKPLKLDDSKYNINSTSTYNGQYNIDSKQIDNVNAFGDMNDEQSSINTKPTYNAIQVANNNYNSYNDTVGELTIQIMNDMDVSTDTDEDYRNMNVDSYNLIPPANMNVDNLNLAPVTNDTDNDVITGIDVDVDVDADIDMNDEILQHALEQSRLQMEVHVLESREREGNEFNTQHINSSQTTNGLMGLHNLGNTCFLNSTVQCLLQCPCLHSYFLKHKYRKQINADNTFGTQGKIVTEWSHLV